MRALHTLDSGHLEVELEFSVCRFPNVAEVAGAVERRMLERRIDVAHGLIERILWRDSQLQPLIQVWLHTFDQSVDDTDGLSFNSFVDQPIGICGRGHISSK